MERCKKIKNSSLFFGQLFLAILILAAAAVIYFVVPQFSLELASRYSEFSDDELTIQIALTIPMLSASAAFLEVMYLQRLVHLNRMFSRSVYKWVRLLAITALVLAASFVALGMWLSSKAALPPLVFLVLIALTIFCLAVSAVTHSLLKLLRRATSATEELEGVV